MTQETDLPHRLLTLRRRLGLDQQEMGERLGVTREWISRLERGRVEFSEEVKRDIRNLEREASDVTAPQISEVKESPAPYGTEAQAEALAAEIHDWIELTMSYAKGDVARLGWLLEQVRQHLRPPEHWIRGVSDEVQQHLDEAARLAAMHRTTRPEDREAAGMGV